ncbi:MAG TPA: DinB family protein [Thermoanaerobaculia bacterium]|nr:DinB family protein [Thermoanaerobaculia bacterium]
MHELLELLLANYDRAYGKDGWHGTSLRRAVRSLRASDVSWRPAAGRHNIWELTAHAAYWKYTVRRRLTGAKRGAFAMKGSNWIASPESVDDDSWRELIALLEDEHRQLREVIASLSAADLRDKKKQRMIYGVAAHDVYHTGQIQLLKRLRG